VALALYLTEVIYARAKDVEVCYNITIRQDWIIIHQLAPSKELWLYLSFMQVFTPLVIILLLTNQTGGLYD